MHTFARIDGDSARVVPATSATLRGEPHGVRAEPQWRRMAPDVDTIYAVLVNALIRRRVELGLTQAEVDHRAGFADCLTAKYETGIRRPSAFALCLWACALNAIIAFAPLTLPEPVREIARPSAPTPDRAATEQRMNDANDEAAMTDEAGACLKGAA